MQVKITNKISYDDQTEQVIQTYDCQLKEKAGFDYLIYQNEENEKVIIKSNHESMTMSRYTNPLTVMKFQDDLDHLMGIATPMGQQYFVIKTDSYVKLDSAIRVQYKLVQENTDLAFAEYDLEITWGIN